MADNLMMGVAGDPILHSLTPRIMELMDPGITCVRLMVDKGENVIPFSQSLGLVGTCVTSPFKRVMMPTPGLGDRAGGVNLIRFRDDQVQGINTDKFGALRMLENVDTESSVAILGTGPAALAAVDSLNDLGIRNPITIVARSDQSPLPRWITHNPKRYRTTNLTRLEEVLDSVDVVIDCLAVNVFQTEQHPTDALYMTPRYTSAKNADAMKWLVGQARHSYLMLFPDRESVRTFDEVMASLEWDAEMDLLGMNSEGSLRRKRHIALIGMPGVGKTSVARELGERLGRPVVDVDQIIQDGFHGPMSIPDFVEREGLLAFRASEEQYLSDVLDNPVPSIIVTGGGACESDVSRTLLRRSAVNIWFYAPVETILKRIQFSDQDHRLFTGCEELKAKDAERHRLYAGVSDAVIDATSDCQSISERITKEFNHVQS